MTVFPYSPANGSEVDEGLLADIVEEALNAFFKVVGDRLDDLYPGTHTYGDVMPGELAERERIAMDWLKSHALNNEAVATATAALGGHPDDCECAPCN